MTDRRKETALRFHCERHQAGIVMEDEPICAAASTVVSPEMTVTSVTITALTRMPASCRPLSMTNEASVDDQRGERRPVSLVCDTRQRDESAARVTRF
jgi:hypothetical protein